MRSQKHCLALAMMNLVGATVAAEFSSDLCPQNASQGNLTVNATNIAEIAGCTQFNWICGPQSDFHLEIVNGTKHPPANCSKFDFNITIDPQTSGSLSIAGVTGADDILFQGSDKQNLKGLDFPDLLNASAFTVENGGRLQVLTLPKLNKLNWNLKLDLRGDDAPPIRLSFPSLESILNADLLGNIDALDMPALKNAAFINITSTGNLDCGTFADSVLGAVFDAGFAEQFGKPNQSVVCTSKTGSVSKSEQPQPRKSGAAMAFQVRGWFLWGLVGVLPVIATVFGMNVL